jgi:PAS domain S-box-containing protein
MLRDPWRSCALQLRQIEQELQQTRKFLADIRSRLQTTALAPLEVEQLVERLQNAVENVQMLYEAVCEQSESLVSATASVYAERERYRDLFERAHDAYLVTDVHGVIREANPQAAALLNTPAEFLIGVPLASFVVTDQRPTFRREFMRLGSVQRVEEWRVALQPHNMPSMQASLAVNTIPDAMARATLLRWSIRDTTERANVATLWRLARGRQQAVCTIAKTDRGLEIGVQSEGATQIRELFSGWDEVLPRAQALRVTMKADGWQDVSSALRPAAQSASA